MEFSEKESVDTDACQTRLEVVSAIREMQPPACHGSRQIIHQKSRKDEGLWKFMESRGDFSQEELGLLTKKGP